MPGQVRGHSHELVSPVTERGEKTKLLLKSWRVWRSSIIIFRSALQMSDAKQTELSAKQACVKSAVARWGRGNRSRENVVGPDSVWCSYSVDGLDGTAVCSAVALKRFDHEGAIMRWILTLSRTFTEYPVWFSAIRRWLLCLTTCSADSKPCLFLKGRDESYKNHIGFVPSEQVVENGIC